MNADAFLKNERPDEYEVSFSVEGEINTTVKAGSLEEAKAVAEAMIDDEGFGFEIDIIDSVSVSRLRKSPAMFLVNRGGAVMQVSRLDEGDLPRQPTDTGF